MQCKNQARKKQIRRGSYYYNGAENWLSNYLFLNSLIEKEQQFPHVQRPCLYNLIALKKSSNIKTAQGNT